MDPQELQANNMSANHLQDPDISHYRQAVQSSRERSHHEPEQRGGKKYCYGCKDQLMITNAILENCKKRNKNLSPAWIDYKKAFESVPHS